MSFELDVSMSGAFDRVFYLHRHGGEFDKHNFSKKLNSQDFPGVGEDDCKLTHTLVLQYQ